MILPTIHMNGTSAKELYEQLEKAFEAIQEAWAALKRASPNGRDYYPQGPQVVYAAEEEHFDRLNRLKSVQDELEEIMGHVGKRL
jgi:hypothetical protein